MADESSQEDRTEDPTARRLDEAIKRGDVARSSELPVFLSLGALTLSLMLLAPLGSGTRLALDLRAFLMNAHQVPSGAGGLLGAGEFGATAALRALALPLGAALVAAVLAGLIGHRPVFSAESMMPKLSRLSPMAGFKRIAGRDAIIAFVRGLLKLGVAGTLVCSMLWRERDR